MNFIFLLNDSKFLSTTHQLISIIAQNTINTDKKNQDLGPELIDR